MPVTPTHTPDTTESMDPRDAAVVMTSHLYLVDTSRGGQPAERCSNCRETWPCAARVAAELTLYGRELDRG